MEQQSLFTSDEAPLPLPPSNGVEFVPPKVDEFEAMSEAARVRFVQSLPTRGLWGGNSVPRGDIRGSYRGIPESPMDMPIIHGTWGSRQQSEGVGVVEDLRYRDSAGNPERIFPRTKT
jgi:hypothetical protein